MHAVWNGPEILRERREVEVIVPEHFLRRASLEKLDQAAIGTPPQSQGRQTIGPGKLLGIEEPVRARHHPQVQDRPQPGMAAGDAADLCRVALEAGHARILRIERRNAPRQRGVDHLVRDQLLDMADPLVARALELLERQFLRPVGLVERLRAAPCVPLRLEPGQHAADLVAVHPVGALVGAGILGEADLAVRNRLGDDLGKIADLVIVLRAPDVERLVADRLCRRLHGSKEGPRDVLDMGDRPPGRAVRLDVDPSRCHRPGHEVVQHEIEPDPRADPIGRGGPEIDRAESVAGEFGEALLGPDLADAVGRQRIQRAGLVDEIRAAHPVVRAGGRIDEPLDADCLGQTREAHRSLEIDRVGRVGMEIPERIVREAREMEDRVEPHQVRRLDLADILQDGGHHRHVAAGREGTPLVEIRVETDDLVTGRTQHRREDGSDIAPMPGYENAHGLIAPTWPMADHRIPRSSADCACRATCPSPPRSRDGDRP